MAWHSYGLYVTSPDGDVVRVRTFRCVGSSMRQIARYVYKQYPEIPRDGVGVFVAHRIWKDGEMIDDRPLPIEPFSNT